MNECLRFLWIAVVLFFSFKGGLAAAEASRPGNVEHGREVYRYAGCYSCHGTLGKGVEGSEGGPRIARGKDTWPLEAIITKVRDPESFAERSDMPFYEAKSLSEADISDIRAFLVSVTDDPSPDSIALLHLK